MKKTLLIPLIYPYLLLLCSLSPIHSAEFSTIIINDIRYKNIERTQWVRTSSGIVVDVDNGQFGIKIETDSGQVHLARGKNARLEVFINNDPCDSMEIQLPRRVKRFRLSAKFDKKANANYVELNLKLGKKLDLKRYDLFILPFLGKLIILPFQKNYTMKIFIISSSTPVANSVFEKELEKFPSLIKREGGQSKSVIARYASIHSNPTRSQFLKRSFCMADFRYFAPL